MNNRGNTIRTPRGTYTTKTLAEKVGVSPDTIRRWKRAGKLPYDVQDNGQLTISLYGQRAVIAALQMKRKSGAQRSADAA